MKNNLYLTQVDFSRKNTRSKSFVQDFKKKENKSSAYLAKNTGFFSAKKNMLEYIISDQTQYADLEKCEDFYKKLFYKNYKDYNIYKSDLSKKKQKLFDLEATLEKVCNYSNKGSCQCLKNREN